jgi:hypothetical protein
MTVPLNWNTVRAKDVERACEELSKQPSDKKSGLIVAYRGRALAAKEVLRLAYRYANDLPDTLGVQFSSGDATLRILQRLGFHAERRVTAEAANEVKRAAVPSKER